MLQVGTPCTRPSAPIVLPDSSKTCQASPPPLFQPVPSVQARIVSPRPLLAKTGCLRFFEELGAAVIGERAPVFGSIRSHWTCPSVSQAARTPVGDSLSTDVLIGHAPMFHSWILSLANVASLWRDVSRYVSRWTISVAER